MDQTDGSFAALIPTDREALCEELEVVDERLHGGLHLRPARGNTLGVIRPHVAWNMSEAVNSGHGAGVDGWSVTCWHLVEALLYDPQTLPHLRHALQVSVTRGNNVIML